MLADFVTRFLLCKISLFQHLFDETVSRHLSKNNINLVKLPAKKRKKTTYFTQNGSILIKIPYKCYQNQCRVHGMVKLAMLGIFLVFFLIQEAQ